MKTSRKKRKEQTAIKIAKEQELNKLKAVVPEKTTSNKKEAKVVKLLPKVGVTKEDLVSAPVSQTENEIDLGVENNEEVRTFEEEQVVEIKSPLAISSLFSSGWPMSNAYRTCGDKDGCDRW